MYLLALLLYAIQIFQESGMTSLKPNITNQVDRGDKESLGHETIYVVGSHSMGVSQTTSSPWVAPSSIAHWLFSPPWFATNSKYGRLYCAMVCKPKFIMGTMAMFSSARHTLLCWVGIKIWPRFMQMSTNSKMWF